MNGIWTIAALDLWESYRRKTVLLIGLTMLALTVFYVVTQFGSEGFMRIPIAELALQTVQGLAVITASFMGAESLSATGEGLAGLAVRPVSRPVIVLGRFLATWIMIVVFLLVAGIVAAAAATLAGSKLVFWSGMLLTAGIAALNGALAVALAMCLAQWLPWVGAAIVGWTTLSVTQAAYQATVLLPMFPGGKAAAPGLRSLTALLPHTVLHVRGAVEIALRGQVLSAGLWTLAFLAVTAIRFHSRDL